MAAGVLPAIVARLFQRYPRISIYMTQSAIAVLEHRTPQYRDLRERNVDLILGPIITPFVEDDLTAEPLFEDKQIVATGVRSRWARSRKLKLADLIDEPWCMPPPDTLVGSRFIEAFRACGLDVPQRKVVASSIQLYLGLLATERFLTIVPDSLLRFSGERFAIKPLPINLSVPPRPIGLVTLKNRTIGPGARLFAQTAREVTKTLRTQRQELLP
jgi:DNA-binding transcriptional LysR family regulator